MVIGIRGSAPLPLADVEPLHIDGFAGYLPYTACSPDRTGAPTNTAWFE